ncbi:hypothetical protein BQ8482_280116 [Mesorhizobium delmotii]|uniref:Uncharacterized protein n=1 Tax=Mesorhizobium delmotii TaxID=1631247 RepID=A0A2P9AMN3_9HYPH|nr:hypothetical protein BQ8482_280116 [Mesorhizobium delmotii]
MTATTILAKPGAARHLIHTCLILRLRNFKLVADVGLGKLPQKIRY